MDLASTVSQGYGKSSHESHNKYGEQEHSSQRQEPDRYSYGGQVQATEPRRTEYQSPYREDQDGRGRRQQESAHGYGSNRDEKSSYRSSEQQSSGYMPSYV